MYLACESTQRAGVPECGPGPRVGSYHCRAAQRRVPAEVILDLMRQYLLRTSTGSS